MNVARDPDLYTLLAADAWEEDRQHRLEADPWTCTSSLVLLPRCGSEGVPRLSGHAAPPTTSELESPRADVNGRGLD